MSLTQILESERVQMLEGQRPRAYKSSLGREPQLLSGQPSERAYQGLKLLEERSFSGPTSIKYWM